MTQRESDGVRFHQCPECGVPQGQRGMARHREQAHGVAPMVKGAKKVRDGGRKHCADTTTHHASHTWETETKSYLCNGIPR